MGLLVLQAVGSGLLGSLAQVAVMAGSLVLVLMLVGLGAFAYKSLRGDGIEWPGDDPDRGDGVSRGGDDDEWKYY